MNNSAHLIAGNNEKPLWSTFTTKIPMTLKAQGMTKAAELNLTPSAWIALLIENAVDPSNSLFVGREEVQAAQERADKLEKELSAVRLKLGTQERQGAKFEENLSKWKEAEKQWQAISKSYKSAEKQWQDQFAETEKKWKKQIDELRKKLVEAQTSFNSERKIRNGLQARLNVANADSAKSTLIGKPKQY